MKTKAVTFSLVVILAVCVFSACNSSGNKGDDTSSQAYKDSVAQANTVVVDTVAPAKADWEKFKADANEKIRQNDDTIQSFKQRIAKSDARIKAKFDHKIAQLEEKNNELKAKLANYNADTKEKFEKFRTDFDNSMDTLGMGIKNLFTGNKK